MTDLSVVVVNYNTAHLLAPMREALEAARGTLNIQLIIVDNASRDDSLEILRRDFSDAIVIANKTNVGFGRANNQAIPHITGRFVLLLNTDAFVGVDTLHRTLAVMQSQPDCGLIGVRLVGRDGTRQPDCRFFPTPLNVFLSRTGMHRLLPWVRLVDPVDPAGDQIQQCDWVPGCYLLIRRNVVDSLGLFDPRFFLYYEEVDFCRRAKAAGWQVLYVPDTTVVHLGGESARSDGPVSTEGQQISALQIESELLYVRKYYGRMGLVGFVVLSGVTDLLHSAKWLIKHRNVRGLVPIRRRASLLWSLVLRTRLGAVPTR